MEKENKPKEAGDSGGGLGSPFDGNSPGVVTVSVGPYVEPLPVAGKTVNEVRKRFKDRLDIDDRSQAILDGVEVDGDTKLKEGMMLMFIHKAGEKGSTPEEVIEFLKNEHKNMAVRYQLLKGIMANDDATQAEAVLRELASPAAVGKPELLKKMEWLKEVIRDLEKGALRVATFTEMLPDSKTQARVVMDNGEVAYSVIPKENGHVDLKCGDEVLLSKDATAILHHMGVHHDTGEEAIFERVIERNLIEVTMRGDDRYVYLAAHKLQEQITNEEVRPGSVVVVSEKKKLAYRAIPAADALSHYRYLVRECVPDVRMDRDIGNPHDCIEDVLEHIRLEMTDPALSREYGLRRSQMRLMAGVSGSGKTYTIQAITNATYQLMSEVTGTPMDKLPPRTFRLRMSSILSCLLGESDKNLARFFQEVEQMADEPYHNNKGEQFILPVIAIIEEVDGLARSRGMDHDGIYDRILTTALQWLDASRPELHKKLIVYIGTTNEPGTIDRAFLRRIGGIIDTFGRLDKKGFMSVLEKHLHKIPVAVARQKAICEVTEWLFEHPQAVEITLQGGTRLLRHRKDMLTGAIIDRAVQQAAKTARAEYRKTKSGKGINIQWLVDGFDAQFQGMISQITPQTARHYVDLPDGASVTALRRVTPSVQVPAVQVTTKTN